MAQFGTISDHERILMIHSAVLIQITRVTDGRTGGIGIAYTALSIVPRSKKWWTHFYDFSGGFGSDPIRFWWRSGFFRGCWIIFQDSSALRDTVYYDCCCHLLNVYELMYAPQPILASSSSLASTEVHVLHWVLSKFLMCSLTQYPLSTPCPEKQESPADARVTRDSTIIPRWPPANWILWNR